MGLNAWEHCVLFETGGLQSKVYLFPSEVEFLEFLREDQLVNIIIIVIFVSTPYQNDLAFIE